MSDGVIPSVFDPEILSNPWPVYEWLREHKPVAFMPDQEMHVVTRYDLCVEAFNKPKIFSSNFGPILDRIKRLWVEAAPEEVRRRYLEITSHLLPQFNTMLTADGAIHDMYRAVTNRIFAAANMRKLDAVVDGICLDAIAALPETGVEFISAFAAPVPLRVIANRLGIPSSDREFFYDAANVIAARLQMSMPDEAEVLRRAEVVVRLQNYMIDMVAERRKSPGDDLCSLLGAETLEEEGGRPLEDYELWSILTQFLVAGHETTTSTFGFGMANLCRSPQLQDKLRNDPKLIRVFVEETLRLDAPVQGLPRLVLEDTELGGYPLKAGEWVMLRGGAANRDERQFGCPAEVDLTRKNARAHLSFGNGMHYCVGAPLGRKELNIGFARLLERFQDFRLDPDRPPPVAAPSIMLRSLPELWVRMEPRV